MIKRFMRSDLGKGSVILFITLNIFNLLNFVFNFLMARLLGPVEYGTLAVLMSLLYIYNVPVEAIQNIISRYSSKFNLKKENKKIKYLVVNSLKKSFKISVSIYILLIIFSLFLSNYLEISFWLIILTNTFVFFAFTIPILRGSLQGLKKFSAFGTTFVIESVFKISLAVFFVLIGLKVFGAIIGVVLAGLLSLFFALYFNQEILKEKKEKFETRNIYSDSFSYLITMLVVFFVFSIDILLAKRFFSPELVGHYSVISILGKTIFMATLAISKAMFPITSEKHDSGKNPKFILKKSFIIVSLISLLSIILFGMIPEFIISLLYGKEFLVLSNLLIYSGIAFSFLSLGNLIFIYGLSTNKLRKPYFLILLIFIPLILLFLFNKDIMEFTLAFMVSNILLFLSSLIILVKKN